ncbi:MAG: L-dopachrome tautomerase-related protein, partial [Candidatus Binataceae bacterium]
MNRRLLLAAAILLSVSSAWAIQLPSERTIGRIEAVFEFQGAMPTGVTVAPNGRIFVNFPRWGDDVPFTVGEIRGGRLFAYPDTEVNRADNAHPAKTFISVQSVVADARNRLWVLDTAAPNFSEPIQGGAKLVAVDLATNRISKTIVFKPDIALPKTYLNDVRFDLRQDKEGIAYITDSGTGALIVVDLASGEAWRRLAN